MIIDFFQLEYFKKQISSMADLVETHAHQHGHHDQHARPQAAHQRAHGHAVVLAVLPPHVHDSELLHGGQAGLLARDAEEKRERQWRTTIAV